MIKGCQKRMIMLRGDADSSFETAFFVMRPEKESKTDSENNDIVAEAVRVANKVFSEEYITQKKHKHKKESSVLQNFAVFLVAFFCGAGFMGVIWATFSLIA